MAGHLSWVTKDDSSESDSIARLDAQESEGARVERILISISEESSAMVAASTRRR
jgi:hypothetical protein